MYPSQNFQFPSPNAEFPSSQRYNRSPQTPVHADKSKGKGEKTTWNIAEEKALCSAYLEAGGDVEKGTDQTRGNFWATVVRLYGDAQRENPSNINKRSGDSIRSYWGKVNHAVGKFVSAYEEAKQRKRSGWNEDTVIGEAREIYRHNCNKKFFFDHIWDILKHYPKWQGGKNVEDQGSGHSSKRSNSDTPTIELRPPGVKRSKRKGKPVSSCQNDMVSVTNSIDRLTTTNRELDVERLQLGKEMFEFMKEKEARKNEKRRFKLYHTLMTKSVRSPDEEELYKRLHTEFKDI